MTITGVITLPLRAISTTITNDFTGVRGEHLPPQGPPSLPTGAGTPEAFQGGAEPRSPLYSQPGVEFSRSKELKFAKRTEEVSAGFLA